jgi:hypothetical protein
MIIERQFSLSIKLTACIVYMIASGAALCPFTVERVGVPAGMGIEGHEEFRWGAAWS